MRLMKRGSELVKAEVYRGEITPRLYRVIPVEVEVVEEEEEVQATPNFFQGLYKALKFWGMVFWAIAGFWLAMALVAKLLGF
ncbi:hypothetical protein CSW29_04035 [Thermus scotoductus]|uniref:Uncharacterized protein n=1 Tax=Thermus scotoductus TaxID=37636 RepID=A0A430UI45_THESC|nr:hypothetical protein [Thermus scotoductus]RTI01514.1 hypothetical protein CSW29_04035 [Thermus scotoductus]